MSEHTNDSRGTASEPSWASGNPAGGGQQGQSAPHPTQPGYPDASYPAPQHQAAPGDGGQPYGQPAYAPQQYGQPQYGGPGHVQQPYGQAQYGQQGYGQQPYGHPGYAQGPAASRQYEPLPAQRSTAATVAGIILALIAALFGLGILAQLANGSAHLRENSAGYAFGYVLGVLLFVGLPALGAYLCLTSHTRKAKKPSQF